MEVVFCASRRKKVTPILGINSRFVCLGLIWGYDLLIATRRMTGGYLVLLCLV